ncbi:hypothetical protein M3J09_005543 [Ascochyta lentis]
MTDQLQIPHTFSILLFARLFVLLSFYVSTIQTC